LLKRLVLRMQPVEAGGYTVDAICHALADDGVCEEMADEIGLEVDELNAGGADGRDRYAGLRPRLASSVGGQSATATADRSQMLLRAALFCGPNCTMSDINRGASALLLTESRSEGLPAAAASAYADQITAGLHTDVEALRADLRHIRAELTVAHSTLAGMANLLRQNELSANRMRRDLINTLARLSDCQLELDAVRQARIDFARDVLRVDQPLDCDAPAPFYTTETFPGVRIPGAVVCNPVQPFDFDIATDGLFATCEASPDPEWLSRLAPLAAAAAQLEPQSLLIIGHADERPVRTEACVTRYGNNTLLSEARAEAIASLFRAELSGVAPDLHIETTGFGDVAPRVQCGPDAPDSCHRLNRRVTIRPVGAQGVEFDFACAGGRR
jgi:outer membrane protein OmpA-like peptidoglycan-associated protein